MKKEKIKEFESFVKVSEKHFSCIPKKSEVYGLECLESDGDFVSFKLKKIQEAEKENFRVPFFDLLESKYSFYRGRYLVTKKNIIIGGLQMNAGTVIGEGVSSGGINLLLFIGRDFQVEKEEDLYIILGIY